MSIMQSQPERSITGVHKYIIEVSTVLNGVKCGQMLTSVRSSGFTDYTVESGGIGG